MTHTKGPWKSTLGGYINSAGGVPLARIIEYKQKNLIEQQKEIEHNGANARLIAAAPELLDVCEQVARLGEASRFGFDSASLLADADDLSQKLLDIIKKARAG